MNKLIPLIFLAAIFTVPAIAVQSAYAGCIGEECGFDPEDEFFNQGPDSPDHTTISPPRGSFGDNGAPTVYWGSPFMVTLDTVAWDLCSGVGDSIVSVNVSLGPFSDNIFFGGEEGFPEAVGIGDFFLQPAYADHGVIITPTTASAPMHDIGDGLWKATFPALIPLHGNAVISYTWVCALAGPLGPLEDGGIFMDPSGQVTNSCNGDPIQNARVTLYSDHFGPILLAPFLSYIPAINPQFTDAFGEYAWDVEPGPDEFNPINYQVVVEATLGTGADQDYVSQTSALLPVPPPQTGVDFALTPILGCPLGAVGGMFMPIDSTSLIIAGTVSTASWLIPVIVSMAGIGIVLVRRK